MLSDLGWRAFVLAPALCYSRAMNESRAIAAVEDVYGSLEELVFFILSEHEDLLEGNTSIGTLSSTLNLDPNVAHFLIHRSNKFRAIIRSDLVNREFDIMAESAHIHEVVRVATNEGASRMNAKGAIVEVDQSPADVMAAGKYLNDYRGTSIQPEKGRVSLGVQVNFIGVAGEGGPIIDVEAIEHDEDERPALPRYRPARLGDLPPVDVRERYALSEGSSSRPPGRTGDELDFYSPEAEEEARDSILAARTRRHAEGRDHDELDVEERLIAEDRQRQRPKRDRESIKERIAKMRPPTVRSFR